MQNIVFIHGMFMNPKSWSAWVPYFQKLGYRCVTPSYPFHDGEPSELRRNMPEGLGKLTMPEVLDFFRKYLIQFDHKPILIGHSMGGAITQMMVNEGLASAGICIDSAPVGGLVSFEWSFLKSNLPIINPFKGDSPVLLTLAQFHYAFCNTMTLDETKEVWEAFVVPESRNIGRTGAVATKLDFAKSHPPLLLIAGQKDHIIPPALNEKNWKSYALNGSITDFKLFPDRSHYICGQKGWQEVAGYIERWLRKVL